MSADGYDITWAAGSGVSGRRKNNWTATTNPGTGDDSADGYEAGSRWLNVTLDIEWVCSDASAGAAVWLQSAQVGAGTDSYQHTQGVASVTWTVVHNLGRYPAITVLDSSNNEIEVEVVHSTTNQAVLTLAYATSGIATCS